MVLVLLGAGLATVASFQDIYETVYRGYAPDQTYSTTLWIVSSNIPENDGKPAFYAAGWPVLIAAVVMAVAVVLMARQRTAFVGRPLAVGAAGVLAGVVYLYVTQVQREKSMMEDWPKTDGLSYEMNIHGGMHLLVVGAVVGLVGAALAQQREQPQPQEEDDDEDGVVVHQLDADDDTPPFGIAILSHEDHQEEQETR